MNTPQQRLVTPEEAAQLINRGETLAIAADEDILAALPAGNWIGGTSVYFMGQDGGITTRGKVFVSPLPSYPGLQATVARYDVATLSQVCVEGPENGFSLIILPAFSEVHFDFAQNASTYEEMFMKPLIGWVAGIHLDDLGKRAPKVRDGRSGNLLENQAVVMHVPVPANVSANVDIVNLCDQGDGDVLEFQTSGFEVSECLVNGKPMSLAKYLQRINHDNRLPLVADYSGAKINVSLKAVDLKQDKVEFYAPIFPHVPYKLAKPLVDRYEVAFAQAAAKLPENANFSCNCILNYLYSELEGNRTGNVTGPMTFGEIAYILLNQTMVHLNLEQHDY
jgi:hypothetical protein